LESRTQVLQALGMIRGYCAIKLAEKIKDGGKRASAHSCAVQMAVHGFGEKDIHLVGVIVVTNKGPLRPGRERCRV
jgi:hypothetical protein